MRWALFWPRVPEPFARHAVHWKHTMSHHHATPTGTPEDVAQAASYLLDARSGFVTGQVLYVCGGMTVGVAGV